MQADQDAQVTAWFVGVAALLIGTAILSSIQGKAREGRTVLTSVVGCVFLLAAIFWSGLKSWLGSQLVASIEGVATNFTVWLLIIGLIWLYSAVMTVLTAVRQNNEIIALRNDVQSIAKVLDRLVLPRYLTPDQKKTISSFLKQFDPYEVSFEITAVQEGF